MGKHPTKPAPRSVKVDAMAEFVILRQRERPGIGYAQLIVDLRAAFDCGKTAAEIGVKRAYEIRRENTERLIGDPNIFEDLYWELYEDAKRNGKMNDARRILDSLRAHLGLGAPQRIELTRGKDAARKLAHLRPDQIEALAALDNPSLVDVEDAQDSTMPAELAHATDDELAALADAGDASTE